MKVEFPGQIFEKKIFKYQIRENLYIECRGITCEQKDLQASRMAGRQIFPSSMTLCQTLHFSHYRSNCSSPSFSSTTFQNIPGISDILFEVSKFQHHPKLCSKFSNLLVSPLKVVQFAGENIPLLVECCFCHGNPGFSFTCTSCFICYHNTQMFERMLFFAMEILDLVSRVHLASFVINTQMFERMLFLPLKSWI